MHPSYSLTHTSLALTHAQGQGGLEHGVGDRRYGGVAHGGADAAAWQLALWGDVRGWQLAL